SGSPVIDDQGNMVGINHRGPVSEDLFTANGVNVYSIGSAAAPVLDALAQPTLPPGMISAFADTTTQAVLDNNIVYRNARVANASIAGVQTDIVGLLGTACDAALARTDYLSIDDLDSALTPCFDATNWIECRTDSASPFSAGSSCPADAATWATRYQAVAEL